MPRPGRLLCCIGFSSTFCLRLGSLVMVHPRRKRENKRNFPQHWAAICRCGTVTFRGKCIGAVTFTSGPRCRIREASPLRRGLVKRGRGAVGLCRSAVADVALGLRVARTCAAAVGRERNLERTNKPRIVYILWCNCSCEQISFRWRLGSPAVVFPRRNLKRNVPHTGPLFVAG